jgi:integrase/recombinase XerD
MTDPEEKLPTDNKAGDISELMDFDSFCRRAEGQSPRTMELVQLALGKLRQYLAENGLPSDLNEIGAREIRGFILYLKTARRFSGHPYASAMDDTLSEHAINTYLRAIRAACNRWVGEGLLRKSPFQGVKLPRLPEKVKPPLTADQLQALLGAVDYASPQGPRDAALLAILTDTVSRTSEITGLKMAHLNLPERYIRVCGKGRQERMVPYGMRTQKLIYKYVNFYRLVPRDSGQDFLFLTGNGRPLTRQRVYAIVRKYARKAGIDTVPCSPHALRRSGCVRWIVNGGDIFSLQKLSGHKSLNVLRKYVELSPSDVKALHEKFSPLDNL